MSFTLKALAKNSRPRFHKTAKRKRCGQKADVTPAFNLSGLKRAPFNTTQFIMHDFESRNKCLGIEDSDNPYNVSPSEKETSPSAMIESDGESFYGSPEGLEEFVQQEFLKDYQSILGEMQIGQTKSAVYSNHLENFNDSFSGKVKVQIP